MNKITFPLTPEMIGNEVSNLHAMLGLILCKCLLFDGNKANCEEFKIALKHDKEQQRYDGATGQLVEIFQEQWGIEAEERGTVDEATAYALNTLLPLGEGLAIEQTIEGQVLLENGLPAAGATLRLYLLKSGGRAEKIQETKTFPNGHYIFSGICGADEASYEIRMIMRPGGDEKEQPLTKPLNYISAENAHIKINLIAPQGGRINSFQSEFTDLRTDIQTKFESEEANIELSDIQENEDRQDITVLNRATGWDGRLIAMASTAERLSKDIQQSTAVNLSSEVIYGLLRAGLPSDPLLLAQVKPEAVGKTVKAVFNAGIIKLIDQPVESIQEQFAEVSRHLRLKLPTSGSNATYEDFLNITKIEKPQKQKFADLFLNHQGTPEQFWDTVREKKILNEKEIHGMQLQGKLASLTGNSLELTKYITSLKVNDPVDLVQKGLYEADPWMEIINQVITENQDPDQPNDNIIPERYRVDSPEGRIRVYASDLARKLRLSYPSNVLVHRLKNDRNNAFNMGDTLQRKAVTTLLEQLLSRGFVLGQTSLGGFCTANPDIEESWGSAKEYAIAYEGVQKLQNTYQVTPDDASMKTLLGMGLGSAHEITSTPESMFVEAYMQQSPKLERVTEAAPKLIYRKAEKVNVVTHNLLVSLKQEQQENYTAPVWKMGGGAPEVEVFKENLTKRFPNMENLFGSVDYCECEHCQSILSPAAYLVDLLQFTEQKNNQGFTVPYDELSERRPDIPHIPLTCENTHTALPYIDVVNEIMEYKVAYDQLDAEAAHDTGNATTEELLAEPQNVISEAYANLCGSPYPLPLPFDLPLETARKFCDYFETPLAEILEAFRPSDTLFAPEQTDGDKVAKYGQFAVFMESLGLSPAEVALFTDIGLLDNWCQLYGYETSEQAQSEKKDNDTGQIIGLNSAKTLSRRLGITYKELLQVIKTGFVNPELNTLAVLYKTGISIRFVKQYEEHQQSHGKQYKQHEPLLNKNESKWEEKEKKQRQSIADKDWDILRDLQAYDKKLERFIREYSRINPDKEAQVKIETQIREKLAQISADFNLPKDKQQWVNRILLLADDDVSCQFETTRVRLANGDPAKPMDFLKINLFVRLWRKLGWSIEETDCALQAFIPKKVPLTSEENLQKQPLKTALVYLSHLKDLENKLNLGKQERLKLLTLWSDIPTTGENSLYAQLFLNRKVLIEFPAFDHSLGFYLTDPKVNIDQNMPALQGALRLTATEIQKILEDAINPEDQPEDGVLTGQLSLAAVSILHRYSLLARGLKLSVHKLITLKRLSGLDPFKPLHADPLANIDQDFPFDQTLRFVESVEAIQTSDFSIEDLEYLFLHKLDPKGKYQPGDTIRMQLLRTMIEGIRTIQSEHPVPDDPTSVTEELLRQKLGLVLPAEVVDQFLSMMNGTWSTTVRNELTANDEPLQASDYKAIPEIIDLSFDEFKKIQSLKFSGVPTDSMRAEMKESLGGQLPDLLTQLLDEINTHARTFYEEHLQKSEAGVIPERGFFAEDDFDLLFSASLKVPQNEAARKAQQAKAGKKLERLINAFWPVLQKRLIRQFVVKNVIAQLQIEPALLDTLLATIQPIVNNKSTELIELFVQVGEAKNAGIDVQLFSTSDTTGKAEKSFIVSDLETEAENFENQVEYKSASLEAYLEVPQSGAYRFYVERKNKDIGCDFLFVHLPDVFISGKDRNKDKLEFDDYLELKAGVFYRFSCRLTNLDKGSVRVLIQGESLPKSGLSQLKLYPASYIQQAEKALLLLSKAQLLLQTLGLNERETHHLQTHPQDFDNFDLAKLPVASSEKYKKESVEQFKALQRLFDYKKLQDDLGGGEDKLVELFGGSNTDSGKSYKLIAELSRRDEDTVKKASETLFSKFDFSNEKHLKRLWQALQIVERFGVSPDTLVKWLNIVSPDTKWEERFAVAQSIKQSVKARYEPEAWQRVAQPIFDKLRQQQRDALVAYLLHKLKLENMEQLYEHFLIDPGMEPVVQTSRIRLAISSMQLFIQRCLMNMEKNVPPASIVNAHQWEWMNRYRVWEANRKIFLFPENWLEPEFRDDKTYLFTELEGALLQEDVSNDLAEEVLLKYLQGMDELSRLDILATHFEYEAGKTSKYHVFGRTFNQPYKYFYRNYEHSIWTPWEPVTAQVEGEHLAPVVWRGRLYLFWVTFMEKPDENAKPGTKSSSGGKPVGEAKFNDLMDDLKDVSAFKRLEVQLHWSEYIKGGWNAGCSGDFNEILEKVPSKYIPDPDVSVEVGQEKGDLFIYLKDCYFSYGFHLIGQNAKPENTLYKKSLCNPYCNAYSFAEEKIIFGINLDSSIDINDCRIILNPNSNFQIIKNNNKVVVTNSSKEVTENSNLNNGAHNTRVGELVSPIFYTNRLNTFFIEPTVTEQTMTEYIEWLKPIPMPEEQEELDTEIPFQAIPPKPHWQIRPDEFYRHVPADEGVFQPTPQQDWLVNPVTTLMFNGKPIGPNGAAGLAVVKQGQKQGQIINVHSGSELATDTAVAVDHTAAFAGSGLKATGDGINVVGASGLNASMVQNYRKSLQSAQATIASILKSGY
ncbi:MAG: Unknown protein [uncultured Thiotrichaceae bacterium]|uniref:Uncharacterized protein n=1 Tax=uncultured Thiotrichaceae bacterium TaxID=298394 RepID=A0A6S6SR59_9GAMM|nr:MAG: Unknown protein [uncultured Thiotrichaceae bacterium]